MDTDGALSSAKTVGDLISISRAPAVVSLTEVERLRDRLGAGDQAEAELSLLLGGYHLGDAETRAACETMLRSLYRAEERGDAFHVAGVYGSGKSHLLAALALLAAHPAQAWPAFLASRDPRPEFRVPSPGPRFLVVSIALDEYPTQSHPLEYVVFSRFEQELVRRHGVRVALTEEAHLLQLVREYVLPQCGAELGEAARAATGKDWQALAEQDSESAARVALKFLRRTGFPLDWRRSRAEAWGALQAALRHHNLDGPVILLDELGLFLAGKDRKGLNTDASFLQYLAQLTAGERCWLTCVTQRGLEEVGDIDRRTLRQMRDRFRTTFTLDLAELGWVVEHRLVRRAEPAAFPDAIARLHACYGQADNDVGFTAQELARAYPLNPVCLQAVQRAAETCLSRTRSVTRLLQEAALTPGWTARPASRLVTADVAFDLLSPEMAHSPEGRRVLRAVESVLVNVKGIAPLRDSQLAPVVKTLGLLALGELRWSVSQLRSALVGCDDATLWQEREAVRQVLSALYRRGTHVERTRREGEDADEYHLDLVSTAGEQMRQRLGELLAELTPEDSRVHRAALEACIESTFPLAGLLDRRSLPVEWQHVRRQIWVACRDLRAVSADELRNLTGALASSQVREDGALFVALPHRVGEQQEGWAVASSDLQPRFARALLAWFPRPLTPSEQDHLIEHAALVRMVADPTVIRRRARELQDRLRARWTDSTAEVCTTLHRAYYEGQVLGPGGETVIESERLWAGFGEWEATLTTAFAPAFAHLFPRFSAIAPARRLVGRAQTNQIIDQFLRPGEVQLPPASALEAHLLAYAAPLGLLEGKERHFRMALSHRELVETVLSATPARQQEDTPDPSEVIAFRELAGALAKSEWGLAREQSELLIAALLRTGYLVALDAFLQPLRFETVAAPLSDFLPYVMRAAPLTEETARKARALWSAATGASGAEWDLPIQERAWRDLLAWSGGLLSAGPRWRASIGEAAPGFGHEPEAWAEVTAALARAEELARGVEASLPSREGLLKLTQVARRLPGGAPACVKWLLAWRRCEQLLGRGLQEMLSLHRLISDDRTSRPEGSLLARQRAEVLSAFADPARLVGEAAAIASAARDWLETYRRHYLAWHERAYAAARFAPLAQLRRKVVAEAARQMARAGLLTDAAAGLEAELSRALGRRCLAGDPLPAGHVVCPLCRLQLAEEVVLPEVEELSRRVGSLLGEQLAALCGQREMLMRRLTGTAEDRVRYAVGALLSAPATTPPEAWAEQAVLILSDDAVAWVRQQLDQPQATPRSLGDLSRALVGRELPKGAVRGAVEEWLGGGEEGIVEVVP